MNATFGSIKLQWINLLVSDVALSDNATRVALFIISQPPKSKLDEFHLFYIEIAQGLKRSTKTVQRAIGELKKQGWLEVQHSPGKGHLCVFAPSAKSLALAESKRYGKGPDKASATRHRRPVNHTKSVNSKGQFRPPIIKEKSESLAREEFLGSTSQPTHPLLFVPKSCADQVNDWLGWLTRFELPSLEALGLETQKLGKTGYHLPSRWPPSEGSTEEVACLQFFHEKISKSANGIRPNSSVRGVS